MAALHTALKTLAPCEFSSVPLNDLHSYLQHAFKDGQLLVDSVPFPPATSKSSSRDRSNTSSSIISNASDVVESSTCPPPTSSAHSALRSEWGKPLKLSAKDNPYGMAVFKLGAKDGRGAWFARRSIHIGMGFSKWKRAMEQEFPETLKTQGGPGEGNIRGIGGEKRVESKEIEGMGKLEVYHLSAQFPGPTAPRDFVTLLLTSESVPSISASESESGDHSSSSSSKEKFLAPHQTPRQYMVISKPCSHPECPPREGFVRGEYESVELIREIPSNKESAPSTDPSTDPDQLEGNGNEDDELSSEKRQSNTSEAEKRALQAVDDVDDSETNPVEWIMITRSDPGGSVPRWMVERGTPASIISDAGKFVNWAVNVESSSTGSSNESELGDDGDVAQSQTEKTFGKEINGHVAAPHKSNLDGATGRSSQWEVDKEEEESGLPSTNTPSTAGVGGGILSTVAETLSTYAPAAVVGRWPGQFSMDAGETSKEMEENPRFDIEHGPTFSKRNSLSRESTVTSVGSFASAEERLTDAGDDDVSSQSPVSASIEQGKPGEIAETNNIQQHQKELAKLNERRMQLEEKMAKKREKDMKNHEQLTAKEARDAKRAEEKHAREMKRQEEKYRREVEKLEAKRAKEARKLEERQRKLQNQDEKSRLAHERDDLRAQLEVCMREREIFALQVAELQRENTTLAARLGKLEGGGREVLRDLQTDLGERSGGSAGSSIKSEGRRSRTFSLGSHGARTSLQRTGSSKSHMSSSPPTARKPHIANGLENKDHGTESSNSAADDKS